MYTINKTSPLPIFYWAQAAPTRYRDRSHWSVKSTQHCRCCTHFPFISVQTMVTTCARLRTASTVFIKHIHSHKNWYLHLPWK